MQNRSIVLAGEDISSSTHVGGELVHLFDIGDSLVDHGALPKITEHELIGSAGCKLRHFDVGAPDPKSLALQPANEMPADKTACATD
jgi:hypothetical protein